MNISEITSRQILDSRGRPTLETVVSLDVGVSGMAAVPSGASTGSHEALELRDGDKQSYGGMSVNKALANVIGPIAKALRGQDVRDQQSIDRIMRELDGTVNKSTLGANAILSVSLATMRANAALNKKYLWQAIQEQYKLPAVSAKHLPRPMMNIINGGRHADTGVKVQEFMIVPDGKTIAERIERGVNVYHQLAATLKKNKLSNLVGDEGGYAPSLSDEQTGLSLIVEAVTAAGYSLPEDVGLAIDFAASEFYDTATQRYALGSTEGGLNSTGMTGLLQEWLDKYPIISLEDPLAEDDWAGWTDLTAKLGNRTMIVGDDLYVTDRNRLERGIELKASNAVLIKVNQIGTLTEAVETAVRAKEAGYRVVVSHRSGETNDSFISDLAVALGAEFLKAGAPARGERVAKYNRLLAIAEEVK